jgi:hypothetical protein
LVCREDRAALRQRLPGAAPQEAVGAAESGFLVGAFRVLRRRSVLPAPAAAPRALCLLAGGDFVRFMVHIPVVLRCVGLPMSSGSARSMHQKTTPE